MRLPLKRHLVALVFVGATGCALFQAGSRVPGDIASDYNCIVAQIEAGNTNVLSYAGACGGIALATVIDIVESLLASPAFVAAHPSAVPTLKVHLLTARATLAAPTVQKEAP